MDQPHGSLTPHASARHFLGAELRHWRQERQLTVAELARRIYVSRELLQKVETAQRRASEELMRACDTALNTGGVLARLLDFINHAERTPAPVNPSPVPSVRVKITAEWVPAEAAHTPSATPPSNDGLAKVYHLTDRRRQVAVILDQPRRADNPVRVLTSASRRRRINPDSARQP